MPAGARDGAAPAEHPLFSGPIAGDRAAGSTADRGAPGKADGPWQLARALVDACIDAMLRADPRRAPAPGGTWEQDVELGLAGTNPVLARFTSHSRARQSLLAWEAGAKKE